MHRETEIRLEKIKNHSRRIESENIDVNIERIRMEDFVIFTNMGDFQKFCHYSKGRRKSLYSKKYFK